MKMMVTRTFVAARSFVQGLVVSGDVVRKVSQVKPLFPPPVFSQFLSHFFPFFILHDIPLIPITVISLFPLKLYSCFPICCWWKWLTASHTFLLESNVAQRIYFLLPLHAHWYSCVKGSVFISLSDPHPFSLMWTPKLTHTYTQPFFFLPVRAHSIKQWQINVGGNERLHKVWPAVQTISPCNNS